MSLLETGFSRYSFRYDNYGANPSSTSIIHSGKTISLRDTIRSAKSVISVSGKNIALKTNVKPSKNGLSFVSYAPRAALNIRYPTGNGVISYTSKTPAIRFNIVIKPQVGITYFNSSSVISNLNVRIRPAKNTLTFRGSRLNKNLDDVLAQPNTARISFNDSPLQIHKGKTVVLNTGDYIISGSSHPGIVINPRNFDYEYYKDRWITPQDREVNNVATDPRANVGISTSNTNSKFTYTSYKTDFIRKAPDTSNNISSGVIGSVGTANNNSAKFTYSKYQDDLHTPDVVIVINTANSIIGVIGGYSNSDLKMSYGNYQNIYHTPTPETVTNTSNNPVIPIGTEDEEFVY